MEKTEVRTVLGGRGFVCVCFGTHQNTKGPHIRVRVVVRKCVLCTSRTVQEKNEPFEDEWESLG